MAAPFGVGELLGIGFKGPDLPTWVSDFAARFGLGAVILFDYDFHAKAYKNNIESPEQVKDLCAAIHDLPSSPLILVDQEGGKVRRLKDKLGFAPLPSAKQFAQLSDEEKKRVATESFKEMVDLGIDMNLAPVLDIDFNPNNPDIGAIERSFSANPQVVSSCTSILNEVAKQTGLQLCLKHYPGLGGATTNSHLELTDLTEAVDQTQLSLFAEWGEKIHGASILISHGLVKDWDQLPVSLSSTALSTLRAQIPSALFMTDDVQMQGLQVFMKTKDAAEKAIEAGADLVLIGNNLLDEQKELFQIAESLEKAFDAKKVWERARGSFERVQARKFLRPASHQ